jgi:hypothetical protein
MCTRRRCIQRSWSLVYCAPTRCLSHATLPHSVRSCRGAPAATMLHPISCTSTRETVAAADFLPHPCFHASPSHEYSKDLVSSINVPCCWALTGQPIATCSAPLSGLAAVPPALCSSLFLLYRACCCIVRRYSFTQLQATPWSRTTWLIRLDSTTPCAASAPFVSAVLQHPAILSCGMNEDHFGGMVRCHLHAAD